MPRYTKTELINKIINNLRTDELELLVTKKKDDTPHDIAMQIENIFYAIPKPILSEIYKKTIIPREKYNNVGLIA